MKNVKRHLGILSIFFMVFVCQLPALAIETRTAPQSTEPTTAENYLLQLGSELHFTNFDCSHLVHSLYERAGLHYPYATSRTLYRGIEEFQRVLQPKSGDVVVWQGHMGIVIDPSQHRFLSALKARVKTSSYISGYWKHRGTPRFFRFAPSGDKSTEATP
jgi:cell wall-associated NlpC family hydrolase